MFDLAKVDQAGNDFIAGRENPLISELDKLLNAATETDLFMSELIAEVCGTSPAIVLANHANAAEGGYLGTERETAELLSYVGVLTV